MKMDQKVGQVSLDSEQPIIMLINIVTLIATVFHSDLVKLAPKAVFIVTKDEKMPQNLLFVVSRVTIIVAALFWRWRHLTRRK